jgi:hypothetical protein
LVQAVGGRGLIKIFHSNAHQDSLRYALSELPKEFNARFSALDR